jgi:hypothetical protein
MGIGHGLLTSVYLKSTLCLLVKFFYDLLQPLKEGVLNNVGKYGIWSYIETWRAHVILDH